MRFTDGAVGDDLIANGAIVDPGAPVMMTSGAAQNPIGPTDVNNDGSTSPLDALNVINAMARQSNVAGESELVVQDRVNQAAVGAVDQAITALTEESVRAPCIEKSKAEQAMAQNWDANDAPSPRQTVRLDHSTSDREGSVDQYLAEAIDFQPLTLSEMSGGEIELLIERCNRL